MIERISNWPAKQLVRYQISGKIYYIFITDRISEKAGYPVNPYIHIRSKRVCTELKYVQYVQEVVTHFI